MRSMREADRVIVLDTGSEDDTVARLRALGAEVFEEKITPWRFDAARNRSLELVPEDADVCVCTDLDEVLLPGWRKALERGWTEGTTLGSYRYTWNYNPDGSEGHVFWQEKMHCRFGYRWKYPVHEVLAWEGEPEKQKRTRLDGVFLEHHADESKSRGQYLPLLEMSVQEDPDDDRNMHYLGREYMFYGRWEDCIRTLKRHLSLPKATWADERAASMRFIARAYWNQGDARSAEIWLLRAIAEAPHLREAYVAMAKLKYAQKDWEGCAYYARGALEIETRPMSYICEGEAWGSLPWDLRALGLYYSGRATESIAPAERALALSPGDARLKENVRIIRQKVNKSVEKAL